MSEGRTNFFVWVAFAALMGFVLGGALVWSPPAAQSHIDCPSHHATSKPCNTDAADDEYFPVLYTLGAWMRKHHIAVEALSAFGTFAFTGVLAFSTLLLWGVTGTAANAAKAASEALPNLERAYISFHVSGNNLPQQMLNARVPGIAAPQVIEAQYYFLNGGRTEAAIDSIRCSYILAEGMSDEPPYFGTAALGDIVEVILPSDPNPKVVPYRCKVVELLNSAKADRIAGGGLFGFFFGAINYRDVFENDHETAWCFRSERDGTLKKWGGKKYNYRT